MSWSARCAIFWMHCALMEPQAHCSSSHVTKTEYLVEAAVEAEASLCFWPLVFFWQDVAPSVLDGTKTKVQVEIKSNKEGLESLSQLLETCGSEWLHIVYSWTNSLKQQQRTCFQYRNSNQELAKAFHLEFHLTSTYLIPADILSKISKVPISLLLSKVFSSLLWFGLGYW